MKLRRFSSCCISFNTVATQDIFCFPNQSTVIQLSYNNTKNNVHHPNQSLESHDIWYEPTTRTTDAILYWLQLYLSIWREISRENPRSSDHSLRFGQFAGVCIISVSIDVSAAYGFCLDDRNFPSQICLKSIIKTSDYMQSFPPTFPPQKQIVKWGREYINLR